MGLTVNVVGFVALFIAITVFSKIKPIFEVADLPTIEDIWWGPGDPKKTDTSIVPFKINVSDAVSTIKI